MLAFVVLGADIVLIVILIVTAVSHLRTRTPYGGTAKHIREAMIRLADIRPGQVIFDIGAGDGRLLIAAKRAEPSIKAIGYECALGIWMIGKVRIWLSHQVVMLRLRDAMKENLTTADRIFLYLGPEMMAKLEEKFDRELRPGTRVVTHAFRFPRRQPVAVEQIQGRWNVKKLFVYEW